MSDDVSSEFAASTMAKSQDNDVREMESWSKTFEADQGRDRPVTIDTLVPQGDAPARPLPEPKPSRRETDDTLGRQEGGTPGAAGGAMRSVAEIPKQIIGGIDSAARNALGFLDPLADWLNTNVADLRYDPVQAPKTTTGKVTRSIAEFLTGFVPAIKAVKAAGVANAAVSSTLAGAIADFSVKDPHEGRLSNLWTEMGLPKNVLTEFLSSRPEDSEAEGRFKNALEGAVVGSAFEGIFMAARALRATRNVRSVQQTETAYLRSKYGELKPEDFKTLGDPTKPVVRTMIQKPSRVGEKVQLPPGDAGADELVGGYGKVSVEPRTVEVKDIPVPTDAERLTTSDLAKGTAIVDGSGKPAIVYHGTHKSFGEISTKRGRISRNNAEVANVLNKLGAHFSSASAVSDNFLPEAGAALRIPKAYKDEIAGLVSPDVPLYAPGANIRPVYLNIKKPFEATEGFFEELLGASSKPTKEQYEAYAKAKFGEGGASDVSGWEMSMLLRGLNKPGILKEVIDDLVDSVLAAGGTADKAKAIKESLQRFGYDGIKYNSREADIMGDAYIAFKDDQIIPVYKEAVDAKIVPESAPRQIALEGQDVYINFARMDSADDVKSVIQEVADANKGRISEAQRGVITQRETEKLAEDLGMTVTDLLARKKGQAFNAEQITAARQLWAASGEKLLEAAKLAEGPNASPVDMFNFRKMLAVHAAIQDEVLGARTEVARSLAAMKIPVGKEGGNIDRARAIEQVMSAMGGQETSKEIAKRIAILAQFGDLTPAVLGKLASRGAGARSVDAIKEVFINSLLSSPKTHIVNIMSNTGVAFQQIYERAAAAGIRTVIGGQGTESGEAAAMAFGMVESIKDAFVLAAKALKTGDTWFAFSKVDLGRVNAVSSEAFRISKETGLGRFVDFVGSVTRVPTRLLGAEDEFFKTIGYRMELRAQALRNAAQEGHKGQAFLTRVAEIINDPPDHIRINAADSAMYNTFTSEVGQFGKAVMNLRNVDSPLNPLILVLPFIRTPVNIARYAFERTPFAPLVKQWRDDVSAGGARADLALARMSTGTAIMAMAMDWADSGIASGQGPMKTADREALQRQGWQPYSIKIGDRWVSYNRADPFGMTMGFATNVAEAIKRGEIDEEDVDEWQEVVGMSIAAISQAAISKTYLEGISNVVEVLSKPQQYSASYVSNLMASFLPATSLNNSVKNLIDPVQREVGSPMDAVMARIAVLSERLPPRRNLWGEEMRSESGLGKTHDFFSPIASKPELKSPIDREMVRINAAQQRIAKVGSFQGVRANFRQYPKAYDDYVRLAGNELKHPVWGLGAKDYLNAVVDGKHSMSQVYQILPDEGRAAFIDSAIRQYRTLAQQAILSDPKHSAFAQEVQRLKENQIQERMPVL